MICIPLCLLIVYVTYKIMDGKYKWKVYDLFCVPIDVTPFIFSYTHTYIDGNIIHCTAFEIESVEQ